MNTRKKSVSRSFFRRWGVSWKRGMDDDAGTSTQVRFVDEGEGCVACVPGHTASEKAIYAEFREHCGTLASTFGDDSRLLFKVVIDNREPSKKAKPLLYVGVPHGAPFSRVLALCNRMFCKADGSGGDEQQQQGAFLLETGFGVNPNKSAGSVFMKYGNELTFHTKVDFSRLAFAR